MNIRGNAIKLKIALVAEQFCLLIQTETA